MALGYTWTAVAFIVFVTVLIYDRMGGFTSKPKFPVKGRTILITGGSEGLGLSLATLLAQRGAHIIIVARTVSKLESALTSIRAAAAQPQTQRFHYLSADLTSPQAVTQMMREAATWNGGQAPEIVFCCAGSAHPGLFAEMETEVLRGDMETDYFSAAYTAHAAIRAWLAGASTTTTTNTKGKTELPEPKHIIFTSSLLAFLSVAGYSPYSPAKTALRSLSETLAQEMLLYAHHTPIETHCVFPGTIFTAGYEREMKLKPGITKKLEEADGGQSAMEVAEGCLKGLDKGEGTIVTSGWLGVAMRSGMLGGGRRGPLLGAVLDQVMSWIVGIVLIFVRREMDAKVVDWGKKENTGGRKELESIVRD